MTANVNDPPLNTYISYYNNATPTDGSNLTTNANDPTHTSTTVVGQTYEEGNTFTSTAFTDYYARAATVDHASEWDWALVDRTAPAGTTYCFRVVKSDGTALTTYTNYAEVTTGTGPAASDFLRGGTWFSNGAKRPKEWAR